MEVVTLRCFIGGRLNPQCFGLVTSGTRPGIAATEHASRLSFWREFEMSHIFARQGLRVDFRPDYSYLLD